MISESNHSAERELQLGAAIAACLEALQAGAETDRQQLLACHPQFAVEIEEFFANQERMERLAAPLREIAQGNPPPANAEAAGALLPAHARLGDFRIVREVGRGGMGVVYEAEQVSLGRRVALKVLPFAATLDAKRLQRFHNEARAAAQLHHTNIVPVIAVGSADGVYYYAMQFIDGRTLATLVRDMRKD